MNKKLIIGDKFRNCNLHFKRAYLCPLNFEKPFIKSHLAENQKDIMYEINESGYPSFKSEKEEYWY